MKFDLCDASKYGELDALMCLVDEGKLKLVFEQSVRPELDVSVVVSRRRQPPSRRFAVFPFRRGVPADPFHVHLDSVAYRTRLFWRLRVAWRSLFCLRFSVCAQRWSTSVSLGMCSSSARTIA